MKKVLIIIGFTLLIAFARCVNDGWNETDEICDSDSDGDCTSLNTTNSTYSCCTYKYEYKKDGNKQKIESCLAIKKDKDVISEYEKIQKEDNKDEGDYTDYKFKGIDCDSQIAKLTFGLVMILAFFF